MKKSTLLILTCTGALLSACSTTYRSGSAQDDIYYSASDEPATAPPAASPSGNASNERPYTPSGGSYQGNNSSDYQPSSQTNDVPAANGNSDYYQPNSTSNYSDGNGNTYVTNNYYNGDDYYDYAYSARLRRFYSPYYGYSYYDPIYTNNYWYDYNPSNFGVSIYTGYSWWAPSYYYYSPFIYGGPHWGMGFSYGWGTPCYTGWYNPGFYSPWHGGYYAPYYSSYNMGYWNGYQHGYYDGSWGLANPYYYNSYDGNFHYGHRGSAVSDNSPRAGSTRDYGTHRAMQSVGGSYVEAVNSGRVIRTSESTPTQPVRPLNGISTKNPNGETPSARPGRGNTEEQDVRGRGTTSSPIQEVAPRDGRATTGKSDLTEPARNPNTSGSDRSNLYNTAPSRGNQSRTEEDARSYQTEPIGTGRSNPRDNDTYPSRSNESPSQPVRPGRSNNYDSRDNNPATRPLQQDSRGSNRQEDMTPVRRNDDNRSLQESRPSRNSWLERNERPSIQSAPSRQPSIREEQRTPTFQPRNEPRQFHQEAPSQPSQRSSSPSFSSPRNNGPSSAPSPGRRR